MSKTANSGLSSTERELLRKVQKVIDGKQPPVLLAPEGGNIQMPSALSEVLTQATRELLLGKSVRILSRGEELSTQSAADYLGYSRPHLIKLLEQGAIPYHLVGSHRRMMQMDLLDYKKRRDQKRREALTHLTQLADDEDYEENGWDEILAR